ncbi:MAG: hypothetical protein ABID61_02390, partial [Candidatus Micrarchaeota archaeon]
VRIILSSPYEGLITNGEQLTDTNGEAVFTLPKSGTYTVSVTKTGYTKPQNIDPVVFTFCLIPPVANTTANVTTNTTTGNVTTNVTTNTTVTENTTITPTNNSIITPSNITAVTSSEASTAVTTASDAISLAKVQGKDVTAAEAKLASAQSEYTAGNYENAKKLADEALKLAQNASASTVTPTTPATTTPVKKDDGLFVIFGGAGLIVLVIAVLAIGVGAYLLFVRKK